MPKITFIGAGSTVFAKNLMGDILSFPELAECTLSLHDIDEERLRTSEIVAKNLAKTMNVTPTIQATTDRRAALDGADYAISMFQVAGYKPGTTTDFEIPKKYGLRQTIADTLGIGGIMRSLRTIPVFLDILDDMEELCPEVTFLNYVNPMAMICWAVSEYSTIKTVGLCHSVFHTAKELSKDIGVPLNEINYLVAGINHMAFYLKFERDGQDLYPLIQKVVDEDRVPAWNMVRYEMFKRLGYFVTESSEHFSEYVPWFIKRDRPDLIEQYSIPLDEYITRCERQIAEWEFWKVALEYRDPAVLACLEQAYEIVGRLGLNDPTEPNRIAQTYLPEIVEGLAKQDPTMLERLEQTYLPELLAQLEKVDPENADQLRQPEKSDEIGSEEATPRVRHSGEYGSLIIHGLETGEPQIIYGNVPNYGIIDNLPEGCCVEVPCLVDKNGIQPTKIGSLPPHLAALMQTNINVQALTVEAALTGKREHIYHAAMLDPHTAAELDLDQIWNLVDDLLEAHAGWLPEYQ